MKNLGRMSNRSKASSKVSVELDIGDSCCKLGFGGKKSHGGNHVPKVNSK